MLKFFSKTPLFSRKKTQFWQHFSAKSVPGAAAAI